VARPPRTAAVSHAYRRIGRSSRKEVHGDRGERTEIASPGSGRTWATLSVVPTPSSAILSAPVDTGIQACPRSAVSMAHGKRAIGSPGSRRTWAPPVRRYVCCFEGPAGADLRSAWACHPISRSLNRTSTLNNTGGRSPPYCPAGATGRSFSTTTSREPTTFPYRSSVSKVTVMVKRSRPPLRSRSLGTRHEYPQVPPQPKGMVPSATRLPAAFVMTTVGSSEYSRV